LLALWFVASFALAELRLKPFADFYGFSVALRERLWAVPPLLALTVALATFPSSRGIGGCGIRCAWLVNELQFCGLRGCSTLPHQVGTLVRANEQCF